VFWTIIRSIWKLYVPSIVQTLDHAKISFLYNSTSVSLGHDPPTVIGVSVKCWPSFGVVIVAATVGGFPGMTPDIPIEPA
jgi:hypothetical protein